MAQDLNGVEIMATGTFTPGGAAKGRRVTISSNDLDEMVASFQELVPIGGFTPVLKLGHTDAQRFMGQGNGAPNLGIVQKIWREGQKVLANFSAVPDAVVDLIRSKRFNSVSVEILPSLEFEGRKFSNVLTAVALLGAELPAVKGLADLSATLFTQAEVKPIEADQIVSFEWESNPMPDVKYTQEQHDSLVEAAVAKALKDAKAKFEADGERLTAERDEARKALETVKTEYADFQTKVRNAEAVSLVEKAVKVGKILPKQKDAALAFAMNLSGTVKFGDEEKSMATLFAEFIDGMPSKVDMSEKGAGSKDDGGEGGTFPDAASEVDARARKAMKANDKLTYAEARKEVLAEDEKLKLAYLDLA
jgi:hypothetical protein